MKTRDPKATKKSQYIRILALLSMLAIVTTIAVLGMDDRGIQYEQGNFVGLSHYIYQWDEGYIGYAPNAYDYENYCNYMMPPTINSNGGEYSYQLGYLGEYYEYEEAYCSAEDSYLSGGTESVNGYIEDCYGYGGYIDYAPYEDYDRLGTQDGLEYFYFYCDYHGRVRQYLSPNVPHDRFAGVGDAYIHAYGGYIGIASLSTPTLPLLPVPFPEVDWPVVVTNIQELQDEINAVPTGTGNAYRIRIHFPNNYYVGYQEVRFAGTGAMASRNIILDSYNGINQVWYHHAGVSRHIVFWAGASLELRNVTLTRDHNVIDPLMWGGGVQASGSRFIMNHPNATISNNRRQFGGGISIPPSYMGDHHIWVILKDGTIEDNFATSHGGGFWGDGASDHRNIFLVLDGVTIRNNTAGENGGGIHYCCRSTTWVAGDTAIYGNAAQHGGGIHPGATYLYVLGGEIRYNTATVNGGGIFVSFYTSIAGGVIRNNRAVGTIPMMGSPVGGHGGGIFNPASPLRIYGGSIIDNQASGSGGGIYIGWADTRFLDITYPLNITGNRAGLDGGGIRIGHGPGVNNTSNTHFPICSLVNISDNVAGRNGGGLFLQGPRHAMLQGGTINNNGGSSTVYIHAGGAHTPAAPSITTANITTQNGGGVQNEGTFVIYYGYISENVAMGTVTLDGSNNPISWAYGHGGGVNVQNSSGSLVLSQAELIFAGQGTDVAYIYGNDARIGGGISISSGVGITSNNTSPVYIMRNEAIHNGGGIGIVSGWSWLNDVNINEHISIYRNTAGRSGGGVYLRSMANGLAFNLNGGSILNNYANGIGVGADAGGGGVFVGSGFTFTINPGSLIAYNTAYVGGGVRVFGQSNAWWGDYRKLIMNGGTIRENTATNTNLAGHGGGGIAIYTTTPLASNGRRAEFTMYDGEIIDNISNLAGGGVNINYNALFNMIGGTIGGNTARQGGGIYTTSFAWTTTWVNIPPWTEIRIPPVVITGGEISYNQATTTPTAQYVAREVDPTTGAVITPGVYNGSGGGIYVVRDAGISIENTNITNNHAYEMGGGIFTEWYQYYVSTLTEVDVYTNLIIADTVTFDDNTAGQGDFLPPTNAYDWTNIPGLLQGGDQSIHNHPINNYDINFRRAPVITIPFTFHKTTSNVYTALSLVNIADITPFLLEGAYFSLFRFEGSGTPPDLVTYPSADWERIYNAVRSTGLLTDPITMGLTPDGIYHLVETLAPAGFQIPFGQWRITHNDSAPGDFTIITVGGAAPSFEYLDGYFYVGNVPGSMLPLTGGFANNRMLWAGGLVLMLGFALWGYWYVATADEKRPRPPRQDSGQAT